MLDNKGFGLCGTEYPLEYLQSLQKEVDEENKTEKVSPAAVSNPVPVSNAVSVSFLFLCELSEKQKTAIAAREMKKEAAGKPVLLKTSLAETSQQSHSSSKGKDLLRFDGMYAFQRVRSFDYLIFKRNGKVYGVPTNGTPNQVASWFHGEDGGAIGMGTYKFSYPSHIAFTLRYDSGRAVEYSGTIEKDRLILDFNDLYFDEKSKGRVFQFKEVEAWRKEHEKKGFFNRLFER